MKIREAANDELNFSIGVMSIMIIIRYHLLHVLFQRHWVK